MKRSIRYLFLKIVRQTGAPEEIAGGVAIGILVGLACPPGIQTLIALGAASVMGCNRLLAIAAVWITNPFTMPFIYSTQLWIGCLITGTPLAEAVTGGLPDDHVEFWDFVLDVRPHLKTAILMFIGAVSTGVVASGLSYYLTKYAVIGFRKARREKRLQRAAEKARASLARLTPHALTHKKSHHAADTPPADPD